jgi:hypothetical protein
MKTILTIVLCTATILISGCAAGITRTGYRLPKNQNASNLQRCPIAIQSNAKYDNTNVVVLGRIDAYDTGFSTDCDEAYVLDIFCKEACALGADLVNVTEEKQPDFWSTCYRANAEFLRFKDREQAKVLLSDAKYAPDLIIDRSEKSKKRAREIIAASVMGGLLGGLVVSAVTVPHGK